MAVTSTLLTSGTSGTDGTSYVTASVSPGANKLILVAVEAGSNTAGVEPSSITGNGLTWVRVNGLASYGGSYDSLSVWRTMGASPSSGAITINFANTQDYATWHVIEVDGVDTGGTNGSGAVVQSVANYSAVAGTTLSLTLAAFGSANNGAFSAWAGYNSTAVRTATPDTGWTELQDTGSSYFYQVSLETQWRADNDTSPGVTWSASQDNRGGVAIELKAAAASTTNGSTASSATVTGAGASTQSAAGSSAGSTLLVGVGASQVDSDCQIIATSSITGVGASRIDADGLITATELSDATGASATIGDGEITAQALLTSAGESQHDADASITAQASIEGIGESSADADGLISSTAIVTAVGSVGGVEESAGTVASAAEIQVVGESSVNVDGLIESTGVLGAASFEEAVAEAPTSGAGAGSGGWTRQALRRKRKEQEWLERIRQEDEELFRLIQLSLPQAIAECVKRQIY